MKKDDLIDAIGRIDGKYVVEAEYQGRIKNSKVFHVSRYQTWISLAACLCILVLAGYIGGSYLLRFDRDEVIGGGEDTSAAITTEEAADEAMPESAPQDTEENTEEFTTDSAEDRVQGASEENAETESAKQQSPLILIEPPALTMTYQKDGTSLSIASGNSSWSYQTDDEEWISVETDAAAPLDQKYDERNTIYLANEISDTNVIELNFGVMPDRLEILNCWKEGSQINENMAANPSEKSTILVPFTDGSYIYEIAAYWDRTGYRGTAYYCLRTVVNE